MRACHSRGGARHGRALLALALTIGASGGSAAAEKASTAPAVRPPVVEDSISSAKRDFDAVKAARNPALQQKGEVPRIGVPDLRTGAPAPGPTAPKKLGTEKKSANWLVEAMEKQQPRKDRGRDSDRDKFGRDTSKSSSDPETEPDDFIETKKRNESDAITAEEDKRKDEPVNPLASYLGEWMTPQDYALLKPSLERSLSKSGLEGSTSPISSLAPSLGPIGGSESNAAPGANVRGALGMLPRENPYLATVGPAPQSPIASGPVFVPPPAPVSSAPSPVMGPAPLAEPPRSKIPEFAKPAQDEKYFKQLKRF